MPTKPMPNKEHAIEFEGLEIPKDKYQPPVKKKGTTDEYHNLNDPEFPVVQDHEFRVKYWTMPHNSFSRYIKYLEEHWEYFNRTRFNGQLKKPRFSLLKDLDALRMRLRGRYGPESRHPLDEQGLLEISPNLFNSPHEGWVNRTLIHEMCHQAVWQVDGPDAWDGEYRVKKGHGPLWAHWMRHAHLPPSQFDDTSNETYMGIDDHKRDQDRKDFKVKVIETRRGRVQVQQPKIFLPIMILFRNEDEPVIGILIGPANVEAKGSRQPSWYYLNVKDKRVYKASLRNAFYLYGNENEQWTTSFWKQEVFREREKLESRNLILPA
jgi:hypothetical protein